MHTHWGVSFLSVLFSTAEKQNKFSNQAYHIQDWGIAADDIQHIPTNGLFHKPAFFEFL
jgi:hypothetical protein